MGKRNPGKVVNAHAGEPVGLRHALNNGDHVQHFAHAAAREAVDFRHKLRRHFNFGELLACGLHVFKRSGQKLDYPCDTAGNLPVSLDVVLNISHADQDHRVFGAVGNVPDFFKGRRLIRQCKFRFINDDRPLVRCDRLQESREKLL